MGTQERLVTAARQLLQQDGPLGLTTRAVCARAGVTAPSLYHHFGTLNGLLNAALAQALAQALTEVAGPPQHDPFTALLQEWDALVALAGREPALFAAVQGRVAADVTLPALTDARQRMGDCVAAIGRNRLLALPEDAACDAVWALAQAAGMLQAKAALAPRTAWSVAALRAAVRTAILAPDQG